MTDLVERAKAFALERHGSQEHGSLPIAAHLEDVAGHVRHFLVNYGYGYSDHVLAAAWLHDTVEDTKTTLNEIGFVFGLDVMTLVGRLTDESGLDRYERHLKTYYRIREDRNAVLIKLCDRRHNHERSIEYGERKYAAMYAREYKYFKVALWRPNEYTTLWNELDTQYHSLVRDYWHEPVKEAV